MNIRTSRTLGLLFLIAALTLARPSGAAANTRLPIEDRTWPIDICRAVAEVNLFDTGWVRPSPDYSDGNWLRDAFWTTGFLGPALGRVALENFGIHLSPEGQAPTRLGRNWGHDQFFEDESTLMFVIWAARDGGQPPERIARAWRWIKLRVANGNFWTGQGNFHTWHDTVVFPRPDVASYNQGLYAAAALAAVQLRVAEVAEADAAIAAYRRLYNPAIGYIPISLNLDYHDASALVGEVIARVLFNRPMLDDWTVISTVRALPRAGSGFVVLAARDGSYLEPEAFGPTSPKGFYQNGGSWLLYDVLAWTVARMAGAPEGRLLAHRRLALEAATGTLNESAATGPARLNGWTFQRDDYGGNAYACTAITLLDKFLGIASSPYYPAGCGPDLGGILGNDRNRAEHVCQVRIPFSMRGTGGTGPTNASGISPPRGPL